MYAKKEVLCLVPLDGSSTTEVSPGDCSEKNVKLTSNYSNIKANAY